MDVLSGKERKHLLQGPEATYVGPLKSRHGSLGAQ